MPESARPIAAVADPAEGAIVKLAILAVGGQGGGVLADWITDVAERNGYVAQSTSVAGVAQRTGATIYYIEMCRDSGRRPVFALSPSQGDVDILIAAELMEAGRAVMRGFVTADRTTLIASSHRISAVSEKIEPGDGRASSAKVMEAARVASKRFIAFDMEKIAIEAGSVISASLLGALAGSDVLPFDPQSYEDAIAGGGRGVKPSLAAYAAAFAKARGDRPPSSAGSGAGPTNEGATHLTPSEAPAKAPSSSTPAAPAGPRVQLAGWDDLSARIDRLPEPVRAMASLGLRKVVDYQDLAYGGEYIDRLERALAVDDQGRGFRFSNAAAKHLANAMCYDDLIRVADLKTRSNRVARVRREVGASNETVLHVTEYFHPRIEEFCGTMPVSVGRYIEDRPQLAAFLDKRINRGRHVRTDSMSGFAMLWAIGGLRRWRRKLLRHQVETEHLERWYGLALDRAATDYALGVEILECRRLIKGYSDTHARGESKFNRVLAGLNLLAGRDDAAEWIRRLREVALKDEKGEMLDGALKTVASLDADATQH